MASPPYCAVRLCVPDDRIDVVKVAVAVGGFVVKLRITGASAMKFGPHTLHGVSRKLMIPVGGGPVNEKGITARSVMNSERKDGLGEAVRLTVGVIPGFAVRVTAGDVLPI